MNVRKQVGKQRPPPQSLTPHGSSLNRPALPSKLSNVNLASQQDTIVDLTEPDTDDGRANQSGMVTEKQELNRKRANTSAHVRNGVYADLDSSDQGDKPDQDGQDVVEADTASYLESTPHAFASLPLPVRPTRLQTGSAHCQSPAKITATERDPSGRAHGLKPPARASRLPHAKTADFFPWSGEHAEDVLNEQVVKSGFADKAPVSNQSEFNTARPTTWPLLKAKSGLHLLSSLFVQVLEKRQALGRCTAPSTFKPPPRVTLTDTKREAWLRDLASPNVPLRKLSRTIPHGIRGKVLLDQCISKAIPTPRAVWLAKCVGANEIRACKRKGISGTAALGGEAKWIREWTVFVEQFLQATVTSCGRPDWQSKMGYAIRLTACFYQEHLLDADHYLDWVLSSLEQSSNEHLPVWIVITQIYWKAFVCQRRRGRRLADAVLLHLYDFLESPEKSTNQQLVVRLQNLLLTLAVSHRGCLIGARSWGKYKAVFEHVYSTGLSSSQIGAMQSVTFGNNRLAASTISSPSSVRSTRLLFFDALDSAGLTVDFQLLTATLYAHMPNIRTATTSLLEWAASTQRAGPARVYLAARMLRYWKTIGHDIDVGVLHALSTSVFPNDVDRDLLHKVVAELVRSADVSFGRYIQWLISTGALSGQNSMDDAGLILAIPNDDLSTNVSNLRRILLQRLGYAADFEQRQIQHLKSALMQTLIDASTNSSAPCATSIITSSSLTGTVKLAIGHWLRGQTAQWTKEIDSNTPTTYGKTSSVPTYQLPLKFRVFCAVRDMFECLGDFPALESALGTASTSNDPAVLAAVADTVSMHAEVFAASGSLSTLVNGLWMQHRLLRSQQPLDRAFLLSLSNLIQHIPADPSHVKLVTSDLALCEQQSSAAACSPASDNMVAMQSGALESDDDLDRVFASGNSMDENLMGRMFSAIAERTVRGKPGLESNDSDYARWFTQLRLLDQPTFDQLVHNLLAKMAGAAGKAQFQALLTALVGSGCVRIELALLAFERKMQAVLSSNPSLAGRLAAHCLQVLVPQCPESDRVNTAESYRLKVAQKWLCCEHTARLFRIVLTSMGSESGEVLSSKSVVQIIKKYAIEASDTVTQELLAQDILPTPVIATRCARLVSAMLHSDSFGSPADLQSQMDSVAASATELSLPFCQLALLLFAQVGSLRPDDQPPASLLAPIRSAIELDSPIWPQLLSILDQAAVEQIHVWATDQIFQRVPWSLEEAVLSRIDRANVEKLLRVAKASSSPDVAHSRLSTLVKDKLRILLAVVAEADDLFYRHRGAGLETVSFWIESLLQLALIYRLDTDGEPGTNICASLLCVLCGLLVQPKLQLQKQLLEHILDVATVVMDNLPLEARASLSRQTSAKHDPRIIFLFGIEQPPDAWLALVTRLHSPSTAGSLASTTTTPTPSPSSSRTSIPGMQQMPRSAPQSANGARPSMSSPTQQRQTSIQGPGQGGIESRTGANGASGTPEVKYAPWSARYWEVMPDVTPNVGLNDTSLSLGLFGARKV